MLNISVVLLTIHIGTFDVQSVDIMENDTSTCFECVYVDGTSARGCFIEYTCTVTSYNGNLNVIRPEKTCKPDINLSNYTIKAYDKESDGTTYTHTPAYLIENTELGRSPSSTHGTFLSTPTSSVILFMTKNSPENSPSLNFKGQNFVFNYNEKVICPFSRYYHWCGNHCFM